MITSFPKPTPIPKEILPKMSIQEFSAPALNPAPIMKKAEAIVMVGLRPNLEQALDAKKLEISAAKYKEDVKS